MATESVKGQRAVVAVGDEGYSARLAFGVDGAVVSVTGHITTPNPAEILTPFVDRVHAQLVDQGARSVRVDLRHLEYMNSSGFKSFVHWVEKLQSLPDAERYRLEFVSSKASRWQRTSLTVLTCFLPAWVEVQTPN